MNDLIQAELLKLRTTRYILGNDRRDTRLRPPQHRA